MPADWTADPEGAYRALAARDARFDGRLWFGVVTTGVYCRPVCPARTPRRENVRVFADPAAAVAAGFRACRRCRPDAAAGSRHWDHRGDLAARALRLIGSGVVDEQGVRGLAERLHVSARHVHRCLVDEVGAGPLQLARSRRAQTARLLIDQTDLPLADIAFSAGFASVRQFNDVMRAEFGQPPSALRRPAGRRPAAASSAEPADERRAVREGAVTVLRLRRREPYDSAAMLAHLAARAVPGIEEVSLEDGWVRRDIRLPAGPAGLLVRLPGRGDHVIVELTGVALPDLATAVRLARRWFDLDADPGAVADVLGRDRALAPLLTTRPGLRVPGSPDPFETLLRAIVGQRVSVAAARQVLRRLLAPGATLLPSAGDLAARDPADLARAGLPRTRALALHAAATAVADGRVDLDPAGDRDAIRTALRGIPGIGPWTVDYLALRGLADPDAFPAADLGLRRGWASLGQEPTGLATSAERWRPWRAYAAQHLWTHDAGPEDRRAVTPSARPHRSSRPHVPSARPRRTPAMSELPPLVAIVLPTPAGPLAVVVDRSACGDRPGAAGAVVSSGFDPVEAVLARVPPAHRRGSEGGPAGGAERSVELRPGLDPGVDPGLRLVSEAVAAWTAGDLDALDRVPVAQPGGPFLQAAWAALRQVPPGTTRTYAELAAAAGRPAAVRAAGTACARNRVAPFVPCHRIVRSDGSLGGYAYGLPVKARLLAHEGVTDL